MSTPKILNTLHTIMDYAVVANHDPKTYWSFCDSVLKGNEETGEMSEAIQIYMGRMPKKSLSEPVQGEIADCINQVIDLFSTLLKDKEIIHKGVIEPRRLVESINLYCRQYDIEDKESLHAMVVRYVLDYQSLRQHVINTGQGFVVSLIRPLLCLGVLFYCFDNKIRLSAIDEVVVDSTITDLHDNYLLRKFQKWQNNQQS